MDYIHNFIAIQKCLSKQVYAEFRTEGEMGGVFILPMILAVFVENSFKHGAFNDPDHPVQILLSVKLDTLFFRAGNNKTKQTAIATTGIGLANVQQLLSIFYSGKHTLKIDETNTTYSTELTLKITS